MQKIHRSIVIAAQREKVWDTMLEDATYREWTAAFNPGSYFKGSWTQGSKILFLGPSPDGRGEGGMVSYVEKASRPEFLSLMHLGIVKDGVEVTRGEEVMRWKGIHENYTFAEKDGGTELSVDMDIPEEARDFMDNAWANALIKLKELAEK